MSQILRLSGQFALDAIHGLEAGFQVTEEPLFFHDLFLGVVHEIGLTLCYRLSCVYCSQFLDIGKRLSQKMSPWFIKRASGMNIFASPIYARSLPRPMR